MYPELSFDVIMLPCAPSIALHQEQNLSIILCLNLLAINCLASDSLGVLIQINKVDMNQIFILTSPFSCLPTPAGTSYIQIQS